MVPFLIGPVDISSSFMMVTAIDNIPYVLVSAFIEQFGETVYGLENNLTTLFNSDNTNENLAIFSVSGDLNAIKFNDLIIGGGMSTDSKGQLINVQNNPETFVISQTQFANWNPPNIFLTMTDYTITKTNGNSVVIGSNKNLIFNILPLIWYFRCPDNSATCCNLNTAGTILSNWFCIYDSTKDWCQNSDDPSQSFPVTSNGWTNIADCTNGNFYTYCPPQQYCGNNNCNGPCQKQTNNCNFKSSQYVCQVDLNKTASNLKWWESPIFIGSIIGLGILIIFFIVLIFIVARHGKKSRTISD